jgi:hypothetical protein
MIYFPRKFWLFGWLLALVWSFAAREAHADVAVGNVVYRDQNANLRFDLGEGVAGVTVQLFGENDDPLSALPVASAVTAGDGSFLLPPVPDGSYIAFIPPSDFGPQGVLEGSLSLPGVTGYALDDDVGEDGFDDPDPATNGIRTPTLTLITGGAPDGQTNETGYLSETDDAQDTDVDLTMDLGFYKPVAVGNLVFADMNSNGHADAGEGIPGVLVSLYVGSQDVETELPYLETRTDSEGRFLFEDLIEGDYRLMIPAIEFNAGKPLSGGLPMSGASPLTDDDTGEDSAVSLLVGVATDAFNLTAGSAPTAATSETGLFADSDDATSDSSTDLTRDFGFTFEAGKAAVGNLVFVDDNGNNVADEGEGRDDVVVMLFAENGTVPLAQRVTAGGGKFLFENLTPGRYFLHIPASEFRLDKSLYAAVSMTGTTSGDDDAGEDGVDAVNPLLTGVSTAVFDLAATGSPTVATGETGLGAASDDFRDDAVDLTRDLGFTAAAYNPVGVGNAVFKDNNGNNRMDASEGVEGVIVQLFTSGSDPQTDAPLGVRTTDPEGLFLFDGLVPGSYFLHIPGSMFGASMPLQLTTSLAGWGLDNGQDDSVDENGSDAADPAATGVSTRTIQLTADFEPTDANGEDGIAATSDNGDDDNLDLTVDFGFSGGCPAIGISPLVSTFPDGRVGVAYSQQLTVSGGTGPYTWTWRAATLAGLPEGVSIDNTGLVSGTPVNSSNHSIIVRVTDSLGCFSELTRDFNIASPLSPLKVGNLVFADANLNGHFDAGEGVDGVTVQMFAAGADPSFATPVMEQVTANGGRFLFTDVTAANYFLHVPANEFGNQGQLRAMVSMPGAGALNSTLDDDADENGTDAVIPSVYGISTPIFSMTLNAEPVGETGFDGTSDDADDANADLTQDLGFQAACSGVAIPAPPNGTFRVAYSQQLAATGGSAPYVYTLVGTLPPGLLMSTGGLISGTPTAAGSYSFEVDVTGVDECVKRVPLTLVVDSGLGVGNLIYLDDDEDDAFDAGEGLSGVVVQLFPEGADAQTAVPLATRTSGTGGFYLFEGLTAGRYFLHVPKEEFALGRPLNGKMSIRNAGTDNGLDDQLDENGLDAVDPTLTGVSTAVFELSAGLEPTDESQAGTQFGEFGQGTTQDATVDANFDLTMDFGFTRNCPLITLTPATLPSIMAGDPIDQSFFASGGTLPYTWTTTLNLPEGLTLSPAGRLTGTVRLPGAYELRLRATDFYGCKAEITVMQEVTVEVPLSVGNLIFIDQNRNGRADEGEGVPNVTVQLYQQGMNPLVVPPVVPAVTTNAQGRYLFTELGEGSFFVHIPTSQFLEGGPLYQHISIPGAGTDNGQDDDVGENGVDTALPASFGISSTVFALTVDGEPTNAGTETGLGSDDDLGMDNDGDMTIDLGFVPLPPQGLTVGNLVYVDADGDTRPDAGEGKDGVTVQVFRQGDNPLFVGPLQSQVTSGGGFYRFTGLEPGNYFVHVPPANFQPGGVLVSHVSVSGFGLDTGADDDVDENGVDAPTPSSTGVSSLFFGLAYYLEAKDSTTETGMGAANDNADDPNGDMTIDFGFRVVCPTITISPSTGSYNTMQSVPMSETFSASGGTAPYTFEAIGSLPAGLTLGSTGVISGTPTTPGTVTFGVKATDAQACTATVNITLTIDPAPAGTSVGNIVFIDRNSNGFADGGEGVSGVTVNLKTSAGVLVTSTSTNGSGIYGFADVLPGTYYLEIPAAMFSSTAPLGGMKSMAGVAVGDDDIGEDGIDAADPRVTGVRTADFTLAIGTAPTSTTGETGLDNGTDDDRDPFTDLTIDLGFTNALPRSFALWQAENALNGQNGANDNPDGDRNSNLMEFALGQSGGSSVEDPQFPGFYIERTVAGSLDAVVCRRAGGVQGLTYAVEANLATVWTELTLTPVVTPKTNGLEEVRFTNIEGDSLLTGLDGGEVRLRVALDADDNGTPEAEAVTPVWNWKRRSLPQRPQTFCMPLVRKDVFTGAVDGVVTGSTLDVTTAVGTGSLAPYFVDGNSYYIEVIGGDHEGHRWDIDEAQSTATMLRMDLSNSRNTMATLPITLQGDLIAIRAHWTFNDLFPVSRFSSNTSQNQADRLITLDRATGLLREFWLFTNSGSPKWVLSGDARLTNQNGRVVDPAEGVFLHARATPVTLPQAGVARTNAFVCPLRAGMNLVGAGWAVPMSPLDRSMTTLAGFQAHPDASQADRIHVWRGDVESMEAYTSYTFMDFGGSQFWDRMGDADLVDAGLEPLFDAWRAAFVISRAGNATWTQQPPTP